MLCWQSCFCKNYERNKASGALLLNTQWCKNDAEKILVSTLRTLSFSDAIVAPLETRIGHMFLTIKNNLWFYLIAYVNLFAVNLYFRMHRQAKGACNQMDHHLCSFSEMIDVWMEVSWYARSIIRNKTLNFIDRFLCGRGSNQKWSHLGRRILIQNLVI